MTDLTNKKNKEELLNGFAQIPLVTTIVTLDGRQENTYGFSETDTGQKSTQQGLPDEKGLPDAEGFVEIDLGSAPGTDELTSTSNTEEENSFSNVMIGLLNTVREVPNFVMKAAEKTVSIFAGERSVETTVTHVIDSIADCFSGMKMSICGLFSHNSNAQADQQCDLEMDPIDPKETSFQEALAKATDMNGETGVVFS